MKIKRLEIDRFGKIENKSFELSPSLTVFVGKNGTGKTTMMEFIHQILFEFPKKNQKEVNYQLHPGKEIGGRLVVDMGDSQEVIISRQSGPGARTGQLEMTKGSQRIPHPSKELSKELHHLNQKELRQLYTFNLEDLQGIKNLPKEDLNEYFQSLTTEGSQKIYQQLNQLQKKAESLYKKSGINPLLNQKFVEYEKIKGKTKKAAERNEAIVRLKEEEKLLKREYEDLLENLEKTEKSAKEIEKLLANTKQVKHIEELSAKIHQDLPAQLNRQTYQEWKEQLNHVHQIERMKQELEEKLASEYTENDETMKAYEKNRMVWEDYLVHHEEAQKLAEELERLKEKDKNMRDQFVFFAPSKMLISPHATQEVALPDPLTDEQIKSYIELSKESEEKNQELRENLVEKENLSRKQTTRTTNHLLEMMENNQTNPQVSANNKHLIFYGVLVLSLVSTFYYVSSVSKNIIFLVVGIMSGIVGVLGLIQENKQYSQSKLSNQALDHFKKENLEIGRTIQKLDEENKKINSDLETIATRLHALLEEAGWPREVYSVEELLKDNERFIKLQHLQYQILTNQNKYKTKEIQLVNIQKSLDGIQVEWIEEMNPLKKQEQINDFLQEIKSYQKAIGSQNKVREDLSWRLQKLTNEEEQAKQQLANTFGDLGVQPEKMKELYNKYLGNEQIQLQIKHLKEQLESFEIKDFTLDQVLNRQAENERLQKEVKEKLQSAQRRLSDKRSEIKFLLQNGDYEESLQEQAIFEAELGALVDEWISLQMGVYLLKTTLSKNMENVFNNIQLNINKYFNFLTDNTYHKVDWDGNILQVVDQQGDYYQIEQLSSGTREQLYYAIRLAFIDETAPNFQFPLIIDDAFVNFDQIRKARAYELLNEFSKNHQVIYFTFDTDVVDYLKEAKIYTLTS